MRCDDSDMKIMPERVSKVFDSAEGAAVAFAREKANGNMDKARALGLRFAQELICKEGGLTSFGVGAFDDARTVTQRKILFSYVVNQVIADLFPKSIVAQSAMSSFYNKIEQESPNLLDLILGHEIDLVIDTPAQGAEHAKDGFVIRRNAIETGVNVLTAMDTARALITSLENTDIKKLTLVDIAEIK